MELLVNDYLSKLGLLQCADTLIGGGLKKGISGGQKKRTCIGIELVTDPGIIFLDEPTSGLDAVSTEELMELLHTLARAGNVVIFTIHQPSTSVFINFDKLILLAAGQVMYQGPAADVPNYFAKAGYPLPDMTNPADWVLVCN
jgi:ABC-type multidrug transport system ATPase subunit